MDWERITELNRKSRADLHIHTCFCDGRDTPELMVRAAVGRGLRVIGFSGHSTTDFDRGACMSEEETKGYRREIERLRQEYNGKIEILMGLERDYYDRGFSKDDWDYFIGSVHYLEKGGGHPSVDDTPEMFEDAVAKLYGGDVYALIDEYFENVSDVIDKLGADIVGHFDLVSKYNTGGEFCGRGRFFDEDDPRYKRAWQRAADKLIKQDALFEINTGAVAKGIRKEPYPSLAIQEYIRERGGRFIFSSDSHSADTICYGFGDLRP